MSTAIIVKLISDNSIYPDLQIQSTDSKTLTIGRNEQSKIKSTRCARQQVAIRIENDQVYIEQLGSNDSFINEIPLKINSKQILNDGDKLHLLENEYSYTVRIERSNLDKSSSIVSTLKRQNTDDEQISYKKQKSSLNKTDQDEEGEKDSLDNQNINDASEENRLNWIQQQLDALQANTTQSLPTTTTTSTPIQKSDPTTTDLWEKPDKGLEVFTSKGVISSEKIAAFDMDGTIILTKSGKVHPTDENDWRIGFDTCFKKLKQLIAENYKLVVFTNQRGLMKATSTDNFRKKIQFIQQKLNVPLQVFVAIHSGRYRKPCIGSWELLQSKYNDGIKIDKSKSFYVGDAAGRPDKWRTKAKKDHSSADRLFAVNLGLKFYTPEEYFLGLSKAIYDMPKFEPKSLRSIQSLLEPSTASMTLDKTEVIVMCGLPASGKSWFVKKHIVPHKYEYVNRDEVGTWQKCVKMAELALSKKQSVVIDNTNLDKESRQRYIEVANTFGVSCRCFVMNVSVEHAKHNNLFRQMIGTDDAHKDVNDIVLMGAQKRYVKPTLDEGFSEIVTINMQPLFNDTDMEELYYQYILDK
ncbi:unnamed protein product [Adineta steineri]|uniref:PNK FHA domain-containing protein n=1 Tax=Adineta steineri TaxID=433720 RepID=A0A816FPW3_9BILA|nr:unnamed protein product [Adineta steineri]CAF1664495.1 unnamed protein product [Adineta steineri]